MDGRLLKDTDGWMDGYRMKKRRKIRSGVASREDASLCGFDEESCVSGREPKGTGSLQVYRGQDNLPTGHYIHTLRESGGRLTR